MRYLRREGLIEGDPGALVATPRVEDKLPAHLEIDEMSRLLETPDLGTPLGRRDRAMLELFYASGLRLSELVGLDLDHVNLSGRMVRVRGKGGKERIVPFNTSAERAMQGVPEGPARTRARGAPAAPGAAERPAPKDAASHGPPRGDRRAPARCSSTSAAGA